MELKKFNKTEKKLQNVLWFLADFRLRHVVVGFFCSICKMSGWNSLISQTSLESKLSSSESFKEKSLYICVMQSIKK